MRGHTEIDFLEEDIRRMNMFTVFGSQSKIVCLDWSRKSHCMTSAPLPLFDPPDFKIHDFRRTRYFREYFLTLINRMRARCVVSIVVHGDPIPY